MRATRERVLIDTGPIVAILAPEDSYHQICIEALRSFDGSLHTCWPVITEATYLLRYSPLAVQRLLGSLDGGWLELLPMEAAEGKSVAAILKRYQNIQPQFADAALVYLAGRERIETIFTLDRRDFSIYKTSRRRALHIIPRSE
jgi:uncharacterized protein